jgi:hypothetical protein
MFKRIIPHIGQGCCVEQKMSFNGESVRILFDCGSKQVNLLKGYIDIMDADIPTILVLSHLHDDHINGIPYLVDHFKKGKNGNIKKLILPNLHKNENIIKIFAASIISSASDSGNSDSDINYLINFVFDPGRSRDFGEIIYVDIEAGESGSGVVSHKEAQYALTIHAGIYPYDIFWIMRLWVDRNIYLNLTSLEDAKISAFAASDFNNPKKSKAIIKLYHNLLKKQEKELNFNKTSMIMATFLSNFKEKPITYFCVNAPNIGFVCTGDYPLDKKSGKEIMKYYADQQYLLHEMMVPHHGSNDYCEFIPFDFIKRAYAQNYPPYKNYQHPGAKTIKNLEDWGIEFINVRENIHEN